MLIISRLRFALATLVLPVTWAFAAQGELASVLVQPAASADLASFEGVVESVRQTVIAAQVAGAVVALPVKAGDSVKEGQVLLRIDARSAQQGSVASQAQSTAARSALELADKDLQRQKQLFQKQFISQSALERAEAQYKTLSDQLKSQIAQANVADIQSGFFVIKAPYAGVVSELPIALGDMAMPGKPLLTMFDPKGLRVSFTVSQAAMNNYQAGQPMKIEFPGLPAGRQWLTASQYKVLPTIDAATHSATLRIDLPESVQDIAPGLFARVWLPLKGGAGNHFYVPAKAIVKRGEMTGLYVIDSQQRVILRQVRLGKTRDGTTEILTGISAGERVALDPAAAVRAVR
ncbi:MAG: efflux RND transporter periplasmic adaptor subunit [Undibacterium curvum]|uniref:efflux RND transporter periplasmic adaptor subunit n=1 Tax=Undibacterium curvum TaxID=2762294 RepID=UPI003BCA0856